MRKSRIPNHRTKMRIIDSFIKAMISRDSFLLCGHHNPDEDCVASMVAFSLLLAKFNKNSSMVLDTENLRKFPYLLSICKYNSIQVLENPEAISDEYDTVIVFDTPKPVMIEFRERVEELMTKDNILVMEIDHHLEADGHYIGDEGYRLVDEASSTCEHIGYLALKISKRGMLRDYGNNEVFTRNFVLSVVTGMVGDSKMGQFLKSRREKRYYRYFSRLFNKMLINKTDKDSANFHSIEDIMKALEALSAEEENCYRSFMEHKKKSKFISYVALDDDQMAGLFETYDMEVIITVARYAANMLAEESGTLSLVAFADHPDRSELIQLRMRRSQNYRALDLRKAIEHLGIQNGGGHEGAVGFRVPKNQIADFAAFIERVVEGTEELMSFI